jgi:ATP-dependent Lon protease
MAKKTATEKKAQPKNKESESIEAIPSVLPVLPLRDNVIYPYMIFPVLVGRETSIKAANYALDNSKYIFLKAQKKASIEEPTRDDIFTEGTIAKIIQILKLPNGLLKILVDGIIQGKIVSFTKNKNFFEANIEVIIPIKEDAKEQNALIRQMTALFKEYVKINRNIPQEAVSAYDNFDEPDRKLFYAAANINQSLEVKQSICKSLR